MREAAVVVSRHGWQVNSSPQERIEQVGSREGTRSGLTGFQRVIRVIECPPAYSPSILSSLSVVPG